MTTYHHIGIASPASSRALWFPPNMDKLALALLLVIASVKFEVRGSSLAVSERALSRVKRLDDTFAPEPKVDVKRSASRSEAESGANHAVTDNGVSDHVKTPAVANPKYHQRRNPEHQATKHSNDIHKDGKTTVIAARRHGMKTRMDESSPEHELQEIGKTSKRRSGRVVSARRRLADHNSIQKPHEHWWHRQRRLWQKRNSEYMNKNGRAMPMKRRWRELRKDDRENQKHRIQNRQPETIENGAVNFSPQKKSDRPTNDQRHLVTRKKSQRHDVTEDEELTLRDAARNFHHSKRLETKRLSDLDDQEINEMDSTKDLVSHVKKIRKHSASKRPKSN